MRPLSPARTVLNSHKRRPRKKIVGWREWVALPLLGVQAIKAKIDTGARTSALHAFDVEPYEVNGEEWVRFALSPLQRKDSRDILCVAPVLDRRWVTNPGGRREKRILIETTILLGNSRWPIELGLTDRDEMGFRLLIGRTAMHNKLVVDPDLSYRARVGRRKRRRKARRRPPADIVGNRPQPNEGETG